MLRNFVAPVAKGEAQQRTLALNAESQGSTLVTYIPSPVPQICYFCILLIFIIWLVNRVVREKMEHRVGAGVMELAEQVVVTS